MFQKTKKWEISTFQWLIEFQRLKKEEKKQQFCADWGRCSEKQLGQNKKYLEIDQFFKEIKDDQIIN